MAYGVHGDEISSGDAALLTAYHLLADRRAGTRSMLDKVVVIIDPMQNPDGRDRFVNFHREGRGVAPDPEPLAAERVQRWAAGRHNHYLFDMNRDWFLQTQVETQTKVAAYLRWQPHVTIDAHEMGANSEYYFDPPADPILELITPKQRDWFARFGTNQGRRFDQYGFPYTSREVYDALLSRIWLDLAHVARLDRNPLGTGRCAADWSSIATTRKSSIITTASGIITSAASRPSRRPRRCPRT